MSDRTSIIYILSGNIICALSGMLASRTILLRCAWPLFFMMSASQEAKGAMDRIKFSQKQAEKIVRLVRYHLFYYNVGEVTESSVRRLVANIGKENVEDLIKVR